MSDPSFAQAQNNVATLLFAVFVFLTVSCAPSVGVWWFLEVSSGWWSASGALWVFGGVLAGCVRLSTDVDLQTTDAN